MRYLLCLCLPYLIQPVTAQQPTPEVPATTLRLSSRLVVLDVVVTDAKGVPVTDLKKEDFTVVENNVPQHIRSVEPPAAHALPPGEIVHSSADLGRIGTAPVNILVLDELNTPFEDNAYSTYSVQKFFKAQPKVMPPTELLVTNDKSFAVLQDFTQTCPPSKQR